MNFTNKSLLLSSFIGHVFKIILEVLINAKYMKKKDYQYMKKEKYDHTYNVALNLKK